MKKHLYVIVVLFSFSCNFRQNADAQKTFKMHKYGGDTVQVNFCVGFDNDTVQFLYKDSVIYSDILTTNYAIGVSGSCLICKYNDNDSVQYELLINEKKTHVSLTEKNKYYHISIDTNSNIVVECDSVEHILY